MQQTHTHNWQIHVARVYILHKCRTTEYIITSFKFRLHKCKTVNYHNLVTQPPHSHTQMHSYSHDIQLSERSRLSFTSFVTRRPVIISRVTLLCSFGAHLHLSIARCMRNAFAAGWPHSFMVESENSELATLTTRDKMEENAKWKSPAIFKWIHANVFALSVFPCISVSDCACQHSFIGRGQRRSMGQTTEIELGKS